MLKPIFLLAYSQLLRKNLLLGEYFHLESVKNYVKIRTTDHAITILQRSSLHNILDQMMPTSEKIKFVKINRSEAILREIITKIKPGTVITVYGEFKSSIDLTL